MSDGTLRELKPHDPEIGVRYPVWGNSDASDVVELLNRGFAVRLYHDGEDGEYFTDHVTRDGGNIAMYNSVWDDGETRDPSDPLESTEAEVGFGVAKAEAIEVLQPGDSIIELGVTA